MKIDFSSEPPKVEEVEKARQERNRYHREYRKAHPEQVKAIQARYWARKAAKRADEEAGERNG